MNPHINIITLGTDNLARATHFYQQGMGFPKKDMPGDISFFPLQGTWLALYPWDLLAQDAAQKDKTADLPNQRFSGVSLAHTVPTPQDVVQVLDQAYRAGARIVKPAASTAWGGFSGYFADLDGHLWEIAHNPFFWPGPGNPFCHAQKDLSD